MGGFKQDVKNAIDVGNIVKPLITTNSPISGYLVKVTATKLNYWSGPGVTYSIKWQIHKGEVYTIVEEKNGWGKFKSGAGWINLNYVKKV